MCYGAANQIGAALWDDCEDWKMATVFTLSEDSDFEFDREARLIRRFEKVRRLLIQIAMTEGFILIGS